MKRLFAVLVIFGFLSPVTADDWRLVWSDEFETEGLPDSSRWNYEEGFVRNNELQYYTRERLENARVENGFLILEARKESYRNARHDPAASGGARRRSQEFAEYTSASVTTLGLAAWQYGRVEVRAKLPRGKGFWPAIWMMGVDREQVGWPACGEIDIMENVGFDPDTIHGTVHTAKYNHTKNTHKGGTVTVSQPYENFHLYAVEWDESRVEFFVDGKSYFSFANDGSGREAWPFDQPMYLLLNVAFGGSWGGKEGVDDTTMPQAMTVDYVRVYQK
jgi:beta-glucanase (GH16 family)